MLNAKQLVLLTCTFCIFLSNASANANSKIFYACETGYQFETKKKAARCIKQERLTFRSPESCANNNSVKVNYVLAVDKMGQQDRCIAKLPKVSNKLPGVSVKGAKNEIDASDFDNKASNKTVNNTAKPVNRSANNRLERQEPRFTHKSFAPQCQKGFKLQVKRGKDACGKENSEVIQAPNKKVSR